MNDLLTVKTLTVCWLVLTGSVTAAESLTVLPRDIYLTGIEARQTLLVGFTENDMLTRVIEGPFEWKSSDETVVKVVEGKAVPIRNGRASVTVTENGNTASVQVVVEGCDQPYQWSFRNHVQSVLSKTGCNSGACHGAAAGKNGFKLSLRGYDPEADFLALTRQARGRRIVADDPGRSLILTKPTGTIPHKGGVRFSEDSAEYKVIAEWIAQGQSAPAASDARIRELKILPERARFKPGTELQMIVQARFSDGHVEDVTRWAKYTSTNHSVCTADDRGYVKVQGSGEGAVIAWYLAQNATAVVTVPYASPDPAVASRAESANFIDDDVQEKLASLKIPASSRSEDSEFLRRITLDTIGRLPTIDEVKDFLADQQVDKRERLIDQLLARPEFVDYWTYQWSDVLLLNGNKLRPEALKAYYSWIRERVANNASWADFARGIILSRGSTVENGAANFYSLHQDPQDMVETTSMAFLGMSIQCAHCHDHPNEKWTNDDYYGMVSLFARVRGKGWGGDSRSGDGNRTIFLADRGEVLQPRTSRPQPPRPLNSEPISFDEQTDRREYLVNWLVSPENPYFAKAIVNRIWANFFGRGLVDAVDDIRLTNPASNDKLFEHLSADLIRHQYDLKSLMKLILQSETYQRSHLALRENDFDQRFHSHSLPRRLKAEVLLDALSQVTDVPTAFKDQPVGTRAMQLADASVVSYFLDTFGRPERNLTCTCERSDEPSMTQVLHLTNGKTIQEKLEDKTGRVSQFVESHLPDPEAIEMVYLAAFSRYPTASERNTLSTLLAEASAEEKRTAMEDLFWSVLTSKEFLFQH